MMAARFFLFLTFVLLCLGGAQPEAFAAKTPLSPDIEEPAASDQTRAPVELDKSKEVVEISELPPEQGNFTPYQEYFYPYRRAFTLRLGQIVSTPEVQKLTTISGIQLFYTTEELVSYEAGADLLTDGRGNIHVSRRFMHAQGKFRPYTKAGAGILVDPADGLALFVNFDNYRLLGAAGFELLVDRTQSARLDFEIGIGSRSVQAIASVGYVWAW